MTVRTKHERLEPLLFRVQLQDTRANAQGRIIGNKHRKGLGTSRADVCWNGRRPCEPEFNFRIRAIAFRNGTLDRNTVSGWNSRADISGNARHFCDGEFNFRIRGRETEARNNLTVWGYSALSNSKSFLIERFPHSLLGFLESRVMKRKSINHCVYINKLFSFVITEVSPNNNTDN